MNNKMKFVATSDPIDLREWVLGDDCYHWLERLALEGLATRLTRLLRREFDNRPPVVWLPFSWASDEDPGDGVGGPAPTDPLMLYVTLPLSDEDENCCYSCSLEGVIDDVIDAHSNPRAGKITNDESRILCAKIAARLVELAQKLANACDPPLETDAPLFAKGVAL